MATRNVKSSFEPIDKLPSNTLKRHPKMDLNKNDLLRLLSYLEGELQARDITIAALKAEKAKQLLYQAKYGRFGLGDPFHALQRDSDGQRDNSFDEAAVKALYDNQLTQLENLIATQRKAQQRMREQLAAVEKRYHKVLAELADEKRKHAQDTAQGDDVTYMLEKERERLKQEVDFEKSTVKRLEKELKKAVSALDEERAASAKHKQVAVLLIKERKRLLQRLVELQHAPPSDGATYSQNQIEAVLEKQQSEFDVEREQLRARMGREELRSKELLAEVERLRLQLDGAHRPPRGASPHSSGIPQPTGGKLYRNTPPSTPPEVRRGPVGAVHESPERDFGGSKAAGGGGMVADASGVKRAIMQFNHTSPTRTPERTITGAEGKPPPLPGDKLSDVAVSRLNVMPSSNTAPSPVFSTPTTGTTVFTTPTGTRISLNVGPSSNLPRKTSPVVRGTPPPIPPNKPQYVPQQQATPRKDAVKMITPRTDSASPVGGSKPQPPTKFGITISKDKITISSPESPNNDSMRPLVGGPAAVARGVAGGGGQLATSGDGTVIRKPSQSNDVDAPTSDITDSLPSATTPNFDFIGPEMADLQQLLVSMVTGTNQSSSSSVDSSSTPTTPTTPDIHSSPIHKHATTANVNELHKLIVTDKVNVNEQTKDGMTATHAAAESGNEECLKLLLNHGGDVNACREDNFTPLHAAAGEGHSRCVELLLDAGADLTAVDLTGWGALYWAATNGHAHVCRALLEHGASIRVTTNANWTPLHGAVHSGHVECLDLLLAHNDSQQQQHRPPDEHSTDVIDMADSDGWTIAHLAAIRETKDCLEVLCQHCTLDVDRRDKWGRTVLEVASKACRDYLDGLDKKNERTCVVTIDVPADPLSATKSTESPYKVGVVKVTSTMPWSVLEEKLSGVLLAHFIETSVGLRTKKTSKFDGGSESPDSPVPFSLGLSMDSVKYFAIGMYHWSPGTPSEKAPFEILCSNGTKQINTILFGWEDTCQYAIGYETLISVPLLQNYLRLVEQYRSVVFYGPSGTGKTFLVRKLAHCLQQKEIQNGNKCELHLLTFTDTFTRDDLLDLMVEKGCLMVEGTPLTPRHVPILVLDNLGIINIADVFRDILIAMENRGPSHCITIEKGSGVTGSYYLHPSCYIIGTMDRSRSTGLELSIQQRFRWVHFRTDAEPIRNLLQRHLLRRLIHRYGGRLPEGDDPVYRAVEWVICVWQRLNDGLAKLGLADLTFGPSQFLSCPIEVNKPKAIHKWLCMLWNHVIAPAVSEAVIRGAGSDSTTAGGQQKVANTALYVLMQRAVVSGCPLSGQEKERYLASFHGSNELDIKMRGDRRDQRGVTPPTTLGISPAVTLSGPVADTPSPDPPPSIVTLQQSLSTQMVVQSSQETSSSTTTITTTVAATTSAVEESDTRDSRREEQSGGEVSVVVVQEEEAGDVPPPLPSSSPPRDLEGAGVTRAKPKLPSPKPQLSKEDLLRSPTSPVRALRQRSQSPSGLPPGGGLNGGVQPSPLVTAPHLRKDLFSAPKVVSPTRLRKFGNGTSSPTGAESHAEDVDGKKASPVRGVSSKEAGLRKTPPRDMPPSDSDLPTRLPPEGEARVPKVVTSSSDSAHKGETCTDATNNNHSV